MALLLRNKESRHCSDLSNIHRHTTASTSSCAIPYANPWLICFLIYLQSLYSSWEQISLEARLKKAEVKMLDGFKTISNLEPFE